jgi:predicted nucleic acid-binding protein
MAVKSKHQSPSSQRVAVDTNVVFDLAAGKDFAAAAVQVLQAQNVELYLPPTVFVELRMEADHGHFPPKQALAKRALEGLQKWGFKPIVFDRAQLDFAHGFAKALRVERLLPAEEVNDARILGESAFFPVEFLLTSDKHLLGIDREQLHVLLAAKQFSKVEIVSPRRFNWWLNRR